MRTLIVANFVTLDASRRRGQVAGQKLTVRSAHRVQSVRS